MARFVLPTLFITPIIWDVIGPPLSSQTSRYPLSNVNRYAMVPSVMIRGSNDPRDRTVCNLAVSAGVNGSSAASYRSKIA